jgi:hypothetical protein
VKAKMTLVQPAAYHDHLEADLTVALHFNSISQNVLRNKPQGQGLILAYEQISCNMV